MNQVLNLFVSLYIVFFCEFVHFCFCKLVFVLASLFFVFVMFVSVFGSFFFPERTRTDTGESKIKRQSFFPSKLYLDNQ